MSAGQSLKEECPMIITVKFEFEIKRSSPPRKKKSPTAKKAAELIVTNINIIQK